MDKETPQYKEPQFVVFYGMLLSLFTMFCFICKKEKPRVIMKQNGTMVTVSQTCDTCGEDCFQWRSQPLLLGRYPAGNLLLSFGVLAAGASISKILLALKHMGLAIYHPRTFFTHQKKLLCPAILHSWKMYQENILSKLKSMKDVVWSGDGRFDSMGHCAKYGAYTMFSCTTNQVVHFELLQVLYFILNNFVGTFYFIVTMDARIWEWRLL